MAKRDKYENYKDVIYYAAALFDLKQDNKQTAINDLLKSVANSNADNLPQKQKSYLLLGDVAYDVKLYPDAFRYYDSAKAVADLPDEYKEKLTVRQAALKTISANIQSIHLQDSLQVLAKMNETERTAAVKKIYRQIRRAQGLKDDATDFGSNTAAIDNGSLFNNTGTNTSEFYFSNAALKSQGQREFKAKWGNRPNVDNWQRQSAIVQTNNTANNTFSVSDVDDIPGNKQKQDTGKAVTFEGLMLNIPVTEPRMEISNQTIIKALFENANLFKDKLDAYPAAVACYEELLRRFPLSKYNEEAMFNLYYCYRQLNLQDKADSIKAVMNEVHPDGNFTNTLNTGNKDTKKQLLLMKTFIIYLLKASTTKLYQRREG